MAEQIPAQSTSQFGTPDPRFWRRWFLGGPLLSEQPRCDLPLAEWLKPDKDEET